MNSDNVSIEYRVKQYRFFHPKEETNREVNSVTSIQFLTLLSPKSGIEP